MSRLLQKTMCLLCLAVLILTSGCSLRIADLTVVSTRNVNLDKVDLDSMPQTRGVIGKDSKFMLCFIPLGVPHLEDAIDDALDKGNGDIMVDGVLYSEGWWFLVGQNTIKVKGNVINTRSAK